MKIVNVTVGSDPEVFVKNAQNEVITPKFIVWGTKNDPLLLHDDGYYIQRDNMAMEFCIPPASTAKEFVKHIDLGIFHCLEFLPEGHDILAKPSLVFPKELIDGDEEALNFGCDPDFNAYTNEQNPKPKASNPYLRSCGGHIHIGYSNPTEEQNLQIIKHLDLYLGLPSLFLDDDTDRRQLYGNAGCFRNKKYGVEYRTLSNFWLKDPKYIHWVYVNSILAIGSINASNQIDANDYIAIENAINTNNKKMARELIEKYHVSFPLDYYDNEGLIYYGKATKKELITDSSEPILIS